MPIGLIAPHILKILPVIEVLQAVNEAIHLFYIISLVEVYISADCTSVSPEILLHFYLCFG